jgi:hypothetical protein
MFSILCNVIYESSTYVKIHVALKTAGYIGLKTRVIFDDGVECSVQL